jgi:hypothetical protein
MRRDKRHRDQVVARAKALYAIWKDVEDPTLTMADFESALNQLLSSVAELELHEEMPEALPKKPTLLN